MNRICCLFGLFLVLSIGTCDARYGLCMFWGAPVGGGLTDALQASFAAAVTNLEQDFPSVPYFSSVQYNVFSVTDKATYIRSILDGEANCSVACFALATLLPNRTFLREEAAMRPHVLFMIGSTSVRDRNYPSNIITFEALCDKEWFLTGALVEKYRPLERQVLVVPYAFEFSYVAHALAAGALYASEESPYHHKPLIVPVNAWNNAGLESIIAGLATANGSSIIAHISESYAVSELAHTNFSFFSIGWSYNEATKFVGSVLVSITRSYEDAFYDMISRWTVNQTVLEPTLTLPCSMHIASIVPTDIVNYVNNLSSLNITEILWNHSDYYNQSGVSLLHGPLAPANVTGLNFITNYSTLQEPFLGAVTCPNNSEASYKTSDVFYVACTPCPPNYFSRQGAACAPCEGEYSSFCASSGSSDSSTVTLIIALVVSVGVVVIALVSVLLCRWSRVLCFKQRRSAKEPLSTDHLSGRTLSDDSIRLAIDGNEFSVGQPPISTVRSGVSLHKCFLNSGTTIGLLQLRMDKDDVEQIIRAASEVPPHPNIVRVLKVRFNDEKALTEMFVEMDSFGFLDKMVEECETTLNENAVRGFLRHILCALEHLHRYSVAHRDLQLSSVLLTTTGVAKLLHTGASRYFDADERSLTITSPDLFLPPELITGDIPSDDYGSVAFRGDVWKLGVCCAEIFNKGKVPWPGVQDKTERELSHSERIGVTERIRKGERPFVHDCASPQVRHFIELCTDPDPLKRPTAAQLLKLQWMDFSSEGVRRSTFPNSTVILDDVPKELIGLGATGSVHKITTESGEHRALKVMNFVLTERRDESKLRRTQKEVATLTQLSHPNVIQYYSLRTERKRDVTTCFIEMELVESGSLRSYITKTPLSADELRHVALAFLKGIAFIHSKNIIHRDIKPGNLLYCGPPSYVKLADFGSAALLNGTVTSNAAQGTMMYMAPEIFREDQPTFAADIWSAGVTLMELATKKTPWFHLTKSEAAIAVVNLINSETALTLPAGLESNLSDLLSRMVLRDPTDRAAAHELLLHDYFSGLP